MYLNGLLNGSLNTRHAISDKETDSHDIESVMDTAGKTLFHVIKSSDIQLGDIPRWFMIEPKGIRTGDNGKGKPKDFEFHSWGLHWLYTINWLTKNKPTSGITFPGDIRCVNPEKYLLQGLSVWEFLVYVCMRSWKGDKKARHQLAKASEDTCLYLASKAVRNEQPAETEQSAALNEWRKVINWLKGLAKELYGLTIERITKAYLDKYG